MFPWHSPRIPQIPPLCPPKRTCQRPPVPVSAAAQPSDDSTASVGTSNPAPVNAPSAISLSKPGKSFTVSVRELQAEDRRNRRIWLGLSIASHSAAEFDAWSTRNAITTKGGFEANPLLKPFAGNGWIYAAIQVEPTVMDYVARKMMYSRHSWERHTWWVPQTASFLGSILCGAHNVSLHSVGELNSSLLPFGRRVVCRSSRQATRIPSTIRN